MKAQNFACKMNDKIRHQRFGLMPHGHWAIKTIASDIALSLLSQFCHSFWMVKLEKPIPLPMHFPVVKQDHQRQTLLLNCKKYSVVRGDIFASVKYHLVSISFCTSFDTNSQISLLYLNAPSGVKTNLTNSCCLVKRKL